MKLVFIRGGGIRKVYIEGRKITLLTAELNFAPLTIDLDKLESKEYQEKLKQSNLNQEDLELAKQMAKLSTQEEIIKDIKKDFQKTGWRLMKKNG